LYFVALILNTASLRDELTAVNH